MKTTEFITETSLIAQEADDMHVDHEVQMARADCYNAAKYAIELHKLLKHMSETQGLDGWVSEKLTLANDYLRTVHEYLMYEAVEEPSMMEFTAESAEYALGYMISETADVTDYNPKSKGGTRKELLAKYAKSGSSKDATAARKAGATQKELHAAKPQIKENASNENPVVNAITHRILTQHRDLFKFGPEAIMAAIDEVAQQFGDVEEIGSSDVSAMVKNVIDILVDSNIVKEDASGGSSSAGGIAISMSGGGSYKPGTGKPKKIGNTSKMAKYTVGKGIYK